MGSFATALYDALLSAGVASDRAREVVDLFDRSVDERYNLHAQVLGTKGDIAELRLAMKNDIAEFRTATKNDLAELRSAMKTDLATKFDLAELRSETSIRFSNMETRIAETKSELVKWMLAALTAQTALLLALKLV